MNNNWEKESELVESLGKLYPKIYYDTVEYKNWQKDNDLKAWWVYLLCEFQLKQRLPRLEEFIKENDRLAWNDYTHYFKITDEQCGK